MDCILFITDYSMRDVGNTFTGYNRRIMDYINLKTMVWLRIVITSIETMTVLINCHASFHVTMLTFTVFRS